MNPTISIIVPVYKIEAYIRDCVDSLLAQTFRDIEIILVDDGSPDRSGEICDQCALLDRRIRVLHKENGGAASARNAGLQMAKGEYIGFIDGDDYIDPDMYRLLYEAATGNDVLISACNYFYVFGEDVQYESQTEELSVLCAAEFFRRCVADDSRLELIAVNKLYHRSVFSGMDEPFPTGKPYEDLGAVYRFIFAADRLAYIDRGMYYYRRFRDGCASAVAYGEHEKIRIGFGHAMEQYVREHAPEVYPEAHAFMMVNTYLTTVGSMINSNTYDREMYLFIRNELRKNRSAIIRGPLKPLKKIQLLVCSLNFGIYRFIYNLTKKA